MSTAQPQELSSDVLVQLRAAGQVLRVGQVCDKVLFLREPIDLPPSDAELLITVNGRTKSYPIYLHHGCRSDSDIVEFF